VIVDRKRKLLSRLTQPKFLFLRLEREEEASVSGRREKEGVLRVRKKKGEKKLVVPTKAQGFLTQITVTKTARGGGRKGRPKTLLFLNGGKKEKIVYFESRGSGKG